MQPEFLQHDFVALHALCAFVFIEFFVEIRFHGGAGGQLTLDRALDGQAGLIRGEFDQLIDQREELFGLLGRDVGGGLGAFTAMGGTIDPRSRRRGGLSRPRGGLLGHGHGDCCERKQDGPDRSAQSPVSNCVPGVYPVSCGHSFSCELPCSPRVWPLPWAEIPASLFKAIIRMRFRARFH